MSDKQLNRWIKRVALLFVVVLVAFVAFYAVDRFRASPAPVVDQRVASLEDALRKDPANTKIRGQLADLYLVNARYEDAIAQYTVLIDAKQEVELASLGRARAHQESGQLDKAITDFDKVVEIAEGGEMAKVDPNLAAAFYGLGTIAISQERPMDAIEPLKKALTISRTDADTLNALAKAYLATGQADKAIEQLTLAVALVPVGWAEPYAQLEAAYKQTGDADGAEWAGAMAAFASGDHATAERRLQAITEGSRGLQAIVGLGIVNETQGNTSAAADWYRKALAIDPNDTTASLGLRRVTAPAASTAPSSTDGSN